MLVQTRKTLIKPHCQSEPLTALGAKAAVTLKEITSQTD